MLRPAAWAPFTAGLLHANSPAGRAGPAGGGDQPGLHAGPPAGCPPGPPAAPGSRMGLQPGTQGPTLKFQTSFTCRHRLRLSSATSSPSRVRESPGVRLLSGAAT